MAGSLTGPYDGDATLDDPDRDQRRRLLAHLQACIGEGFCPVHKVLMRPAYLRDDVTAGFCAACGSYWYANREKAGCQLDAETLRARLAGWPP